MVTRGFSDTIDGNITVGGGSQGLRRINGYLGGVAGDREDVHAVYGQIRSNGDFSERARFARTYTNISDGVKVSGAEVLLRGPLSDSLSFDVSYTYSKEVNQSTGKQIQDRPRRQYKGSLTYSYSF